MRRNKFSLSHYKLLTCNMGEIIPICWFEGYPGDTIQHRTNLLMRLSPLLAPILHPVRIRIHHWFVPYRLIWDDWENWITGGEDGLNANTWPYITVTNPTEGSLHDYLGVPIGTHTTNISALPFRAYATIFNEHYRDEQLVTALTVDTTDGADSTTNTTIKKCSWEKDYFTASRPYEQLGSEVSIPLVGDAPLTGIGLGNQTESGTSATAWETGDAPSGSSSYAKYYNDTGNILVEESSDDGYPNMYADLSAATGVSVNDLRLYLALQRYKENRNDFGARYIEYVRHAFRGVRSSDARLQNPEYLGGGRQVISFSEVLSTADSGTDVVGTMRGHGIAAMRSNRYRRFLEEHGIVMTLMSVVPKAIYADGLHRSWSKSTKEDYFQRELAHIGDQAVLNKEVYVEHSSPAGTFGYQHRYDELRGHPSQVHGEFLSSLNHWHYARMFSGDQALNETFITANPTKRQYADNSSDVLYVMANHSIQARRMMPKYPSKRIV